MTVEVELIVLDEMPRLLSYFRAKIPRRGNNKGVSFFALRLNLIKLHHGYSFVPKLSFLELNFKVPFYSVCVLLDSIYNFSPSEVMKLLH